MRKLGRRRARDQQHRAAPEYSLAGWVDNQAPGRMRAARSLAHKSMRHAQSRPATSARNQANAIRALENQAVLWSVRLQARPGQPKPKPSSHLSPPTRATIKHTHTHTIRCTSPWCVVCLLVRIKCNSYTLCCTRDSARKVRSVVRAEQRREPKLA